MLFFVAPPDLVHLACLKENRLESRRQEMGGGGTMAKLTSAFCSRQGQTPAKQK